MQIDINHKKMKFYEKILYIFYGHDSGIEVYLYKIFKLKYERKYESKQYE